MDFAAISAGASVASGVMGFKGNRAAAQQAKNIAAYNAEVEKNNAVLLARAKRDSELQVRQSGRRLVGAQRVLAAASGIQEKGQVLQTYADAYFGIERDVARVQYASSVEQARSVAEQRKSIIEGQARAQTYSARAFGSLLGGVTQGLGTYAELGGFED